MPKFVKKFEILMRETKSKRVLADYLICRAAQNDVDFLTNKIRDRRFKFDTVLNGEAKMQVRWKECLNSTSVSLGSGIGALYVRKYFGPESKKSAEELAVDIEQEFKKILEKIEWMDGKTRRGALDKLGSMNNFIGYPDELFDIKKIDEFFKKVETSSNNYLDAAANITIFWYDYLFNRLRLPVSESDWTAYGHTAVVNAAYHAEANSIEVPAGYLQEFFYNKDRPQYLNYGLTGWTIGHEITHGFEKKGSQFDKNGNLKDWWSPETNKKFLEADCMIKQYGNYTAKGVDLKVNGVNTLNENIADNGGLKEAYLAYQDLVKRKGPEPLLPGMKYSQSQLFWISAASSFCKKQRPEFLKDYIMTNVYSPAEFRVLSSFSNCPEFARDFNCQPDSKMNPVKKCSVW